MFNCKTKEIKVSKHKDTKYSAFELKSDILDEAGSYGGNQSAPSNLKVSEKEFNELYGIAKKYDPKMSQVTFENLLKRLRSEGCGYVALVNMIFMEYEYMDDIFEQDFGFSRKRSDETLNFNMMLVDLYVATDNHNTYEYFESGVIPWLVYLNDFYNLFEDQDKEEKKEERYNLANDITGYGTNYKKCRHRILLYLYKKSLAMDYSYTYSYSDNPISNTKFIYANIKKKKHILLSLHNGNVQKKDGSIFQYCPGHFMLVTGINEDGRLIMSTWGKKLYLDPKEVIEKDGKKTRIGYVYYKFHFKNLKLRYTRWKRRKKASKDNY